MPELVTKYPEVALRLLKEANIACGEGKAQTILTNCPKDQFCSLPTGELCIYGIDDVPSMTQLHEFDLFNFPTFYIPFISLVVMAFLGGIIAGMKYVKK